MTISEDLPKGTPQRERRRRRRVLTLRNAGKFAAAVILLFVAVSLVSEFRHRGNEPGEYGRLYSRRTRHADLEPRKPYTVIDETSISDETGADPMLLEAARRQQYLGVTDADIAAMRAAANPQTDTTGTMFIPGSNQPVLQQNSDREKARFEITGGRDGVTVKKD